MYSIEIPNKITQSLNRYETLYDRYIDETTNDNYSSDKWNSLIDSIYVDGIKTKLEKQLKIQIVIMSYGKLISIHIMIIFKIQFIV